MSAPHYLSEGYTSLTPYLCVDGGAAAIDFYCRVFGATVASRNDGPNGTVAHAELQFPTGRLQLSDPNPEHHLVAPTGGADVSRSTVIYVPDVDAVYAAAMDAGSTSVAEPETFVNGERFGVIHCPWGHRWAIITRVEDVSPEEAERRVNEWLAAQESAPEADQQA